MFLATHAAASVTLVHVKKIFLDFQSLKPLPKKITPKIYKNKFFLNVDSSELNFHNEEVFRSQKIVFHTCFEEIKIPYEEFCEDDEELREFFESFRELFESFREFFEVLRGLFEVKFVPL